MWVRECKRQWLTEESVDSDEVFVESDGIEFVHYSRMGDWFVAISVSFWK